MADLLHDPAGVEWRHKVGIAGPLDGSAKASTRLLAVNGWVIKTRIDQAFPSADAALGWLSAARAPGRGAGIWHPDKLWAVMRVADVWHPLTVCRELSTLRQLGDLEERFSAWIEMIQMGLDVHQVHGLGLDLNPANFAREPMSTRLFYLDEEFYDGLSARNVAGAIVARIPEERDATSRDWARYGALLWAHLGLGSFSWSDIAEEIRQYPLPERFEADRDALAAEWKARAQKGGPARMPTDGGAVTCILADVHGNLPALEAVLKEARELGARDFLFLGDAVGYGPNPAECVAVLAELPRATFVRGNHDHAIATGHLDTGMNGLAREAGAWTRETLGPADLAWLGALPIDCFGDGWMAVHGSPKDPKRFFAYVYELTYEDNLRCLKERRIPICFYGHTHVQLTHVELASGPSKLAGERTLDLSPRHYWLVNPGSVGQPRDGDPRAAFALWDRRTGQLITRRVSYDVERTIRDLRAKGLPSKLEHRLRVGS